MHRSQINKIAKVCSCAACFSAIATIACAETPVKLKFRFTTGQTYSYQTNGQIVVQLPTGGKGAAGTPGKPGAMTIPVNSSQKFRVIKVEPNGNAELELTSSGSAATNPGAAGGNAGMTTSKITATPLGVMTPESSAKQTGFAAIGALGGLQTMGSVTAYLPEKPVSIGDHWSMTFKQPALNGTATVTGVFVKMSQVGRFKTAHLRFTMTLPFTISLGAALNAAGGQKPAGAKAPNGDLVGKVQMTYEVDFSAADGRLIKSSGSGTSQFSMKTASGAGMPGDMSSKMTLSSTLVQ